MKASRLLNTRVLCGSDGPMRGLVKDARVRDNHIEILVLSMGGIFSQALFIKPEDIITMSMEGMAVSDEDSFYRLKAKDMKRYVEGSHSLTDVQVYDIRDTLIGKIVDSSIDDDFNVVEYEVSRSLFDDLDRGFALIPADELTFSDGALHYGKRYYEIPKTNREGGIVRRILGEEHYEDFTE